VNASSSDSGDILPVMEGGGKGRKGREGRGGRNEGRKGKIFSVKCSN